MSYEPSQVTPPPIVVSLEDWEKKLLESFDASFPGDTEELAGEPGSTFEAWFWVRKLRSDIESVIEGRNTTSRLSNSTVWELVKRWLSRRGDSIGEQYSCVSRLARLEKDNQGLRTWLTSAGQEPDFTAESVSIRPQEDDRRYWAIAVRALHCLPPSWRGVAPDEPLHRKFGFYEISNTHDTSNFDGPVVRVLHVPLEPEMTQAAEPSSEPPTTHHESDESRAATGQGHGGSGNTTPALDTTEESEAGQHSDSNQLSGLSSPLESERYHVWADDNEPMALSYSHADYRATRTSLMSKLKLSEEAPTPESALQRVLDKLALLVLVRDESGGQAMEDREGGEEAVAGSALGVSKSDSTHLFYRMFEIWDLSRMAASVRRRQLREAALAGDPKTEASPLLLLALEDPRRWLEYIPRSELTMCEDRTISPGCELLWHPPARLLLDHHLFTEEEVFKHCVETGFVFPEYECNGSIVFVASKFSQSPIKEPNADLQYLWNDCAVTTDDDGDWLLLETKPGREFRELASKFSLSAARAAFRRKVDAACFGRPHNLGCVLQNTYADLTGIDAYLDLADTVRHEELLSWEPIPLGGHSQDVYRAKWECPPRLGMLSATTFDVVLKRIWSPGPQHLQPRTEALQLRELMLTLLASSRRPSGLSILHGLMRVPSDKVPSSIAARTGGSDERGRDHLFLVFEHARKSLVGYLEEVLEGNDKDWNVIVDCFQDLAHSIRAIHSHQIVHRLGRNGISDIHLDNIMIREETYYASPTVLSGDQLIIIDFGESRTLDTIDESCESYGAVDYRAPEISLEKKWSMASDIYAIGRAMSEVLKIRYNKLKLEVGDELEDIGNMRVPKPLLDAIGSCLEEEPEKRPAAWELEDTMRNMTFTKSEDSGVLILDLKTMGSDELGKMSWFTG